ncbi:hypothetical protein GNP80_03605 [Aliivibrio fischeri]|uniref:hypothetical protein n=1 Tax=Aliivibrio fischeri TaxID=668 RepID=UPI0012D8E328|nr:hypothetical protein [Aliivibrio fischeri]MUK91536.1 hypothetical protein [Aliivibrio fischeri]
MLKTRLRDVAKNAKVSEAEKKAAYKKLSQAKKHAKAAKEAFEKQGIKGIRLMA